MAAPINTPSTADIWHLSIDDLLAPLPERTRLGGPGPFVINLSASSAPIDVPMKSLAGCEQTHMYQVQRTEDRRPRYRLRLGPFVNEDIAETILQKVRDLYPSALTATADADDLRAIATLQAKATPAQAPPPVAAKPAALPPPVLIAEQKGPVRIASAAPTAVPPPVLTAEHKVPVRVVPTAPALVPLSAPASVARPPAASPPVLRHAVEFSRGVANLESTQTVRALTQLELEDAQASRWYVIQLSLSEDACDPDTVPNLDIFRVYRLYSVAGIDQGRIVHALRVGFFSEEIAAAAVANYLTAFYDEPAIKRVSAAERQRFAQHPLEPRKDVGATGKQAVIEITSERFVRERRPGLTLSK